MKILAVNKALGLLILVLLLTVSCEKNYPQTIIENPAPTYGLVKAVLDYDVAALANIPASSATPFIPLDCRTTAYTAGEGERALITLNTSLTTSSLANNLLSCSVGVEVNGSGTFTEVSSRVYGNTTYGSIALGVTKSYPLEVGKTYVFATVLSCPTATPLNKFSSLCTVMVVKQ